MDPTRDTASQAKKDDDSRFSLTIEKVAGQYEKAGLPRSIRTLQRYCAHGNLDCIKVPTQLGDVYLVAADSVVRHIAELRQVLAATVFVAGRGETRHGMKPYVSEFDQSLPSEPATPELDSSRQSATKRDKRHYRVALCRSA